MRTIEGFDDGTPDLNHPEEPKPHADDKSVTEVHGFQPLFRALFHNPAVAENVFAREAKKQFRPFTEGARRCEAKESRELRPIWTLEASVSFDIAGDLIESDLENWNRSLEELVQTFGQGVVQLLNKRGRLVLIDPLQVRIQRIDESLFRFVIKQKWAPETNNE